MNPAAKPADAAAAAPPRPLRRRHYIACLVLAATCGALMLHAGVQTRRADLWKLESLTLRSRLDAQAAAEPASNPAESGYYKTTLIGEDGAQTSLEGTSIQIEQGGGRLLEIFLERQYDNWLLAWAPAHRDDKYFNWPSFRPYCANQFAVEMDRIENQGDAAQKVAYDAPAAGSRAGLSGALAVAERHLREQAVFAPVRGAGSGSTESGYYKTTLIGKDGSRTPLEGKAIQIEQGGGRLLEVYLQQRPHNRLLFYSPVRRDDKYFNWPVIRPGAANLFYIQMDRLENRSDLTPRLAYDAPR